MSISAFEDAVRAHFANPPATWHVQPAPDCSWSVVDVHGAPVERCSTQADAEQARHSGPAAARWYCRTDWYLGYDATGRALSALERLIVAEVVEAVARAEAAVRQAAVVRPARLLEQDINDDRIWAAALLPNNRYQLGGDYFATHDASDLDFIDQQAKEDLAGFLRQLLSGEEPVVSTW